MTDLDTTDAAAGPAAGPWVSPLPPPPADGRPAPEEWILTYARNELAKAGMTLTDAEFESSIELNRLQLLYPGEYVVYREHPALHSTDWGIVRHEVLFHSPDRPACEAYIRSLPEADRRSLSPPYYVDHPNVLPADLVARLS